MFATCVKGLSPGMLGLLPTILLSSTETHTHRAEGPALHQSQTAQATWDDQVIKPILN